MRGRQRCSAAVILLLAGCVTIPPPDPVVIAGADRIAADAAGFYAALAPKTAPDCGFAANAGEYARLEGESGALRTHVAGAHDPAVQSAIDRLDTAIMGAEHSHQLASAKLDDPAGLCLAPAVLTLNADAIARATAAIKTLQTARGTR